MDMRQSDGRHSESGRNLGKAMGQSDTQAKVPAYRRIKEYILEHVHRGLWSAERPIPTEEALARQFQVSRMTVNRAMRELTDEQVLTRIQGSGTFITQQKYQSTLVQIRAIADEIRERGHEYTCHVQRLMEIRADENLASLFRLRPGARLYHSIIISEENGEAIQAEYRWVNPALAGEYLRQDFTRTTPNAYLSKVAPLQGANYRIEACLATIPVARFLALAPGDPCLVLHRTTFSLDQVASVATMWHPGHRYQFVGSY